MSHIYLRMICQLILVAERKAINTDFKGTKAIKVNMCLVISQLTCTVVFFYPCTTVYLQKKLDIKLLDDLFWFFNFQTLFVAFRTIFKPKFWTNLLNHCWIIEINFCLLHTNYTETTSVKMKVLIDPTVFNYRHQENTRNSIIRCRYVSQLEFTP